MTDLTALRADLDAIDDAIHDLLMRRAAIVTRIGRQKAQSNAARLRPGREATILRRLLARHDGPLDPAAITRVWREILAGSLALQAPFTLAVAGAGLAPLARAHFGAGAPIATVPTAQAALATLLDATADAAILPAPATWVAVLAEAPSLHVVARIPFHRPLAETAYVVAPHPPDPSGDDRSLLALQDASPERLARFAAPPLHGTDGWTLLDLPGFDAAGLACASLPCRARAIGAYATPIA
jgi:chorismate mutase-like protein